MHPAIMMLIFSMTFRGVFGFKWYARMLGKRHCPPRRGDLTAGGSEVNGAKSCIIGLHFTNAGISIFKKFCFCVIIRNDSEIGGKCDYFRVFLKVLGVLRRKLYQSINEVYMSVCWLIISLLLLFRQNLQTVHNERHRQKLSSPFFYMNFPTAILLQDSLYMYTNFSDRISDAWIITSVSEQGKNCFKLDETL